jgi:hypothetical protein
VDNVVENDIDGSLTQGYLAAQGFEKMQVTIEEFDEAKQILYLLLNSAWGNLLALQGNENKLELTFELFTGFQKREKFI